MSTIWSKRPCVLVLEWNFHNRVALSQDSLISQYMCMSITKSIIFLSQIHVPCKVLCFLLEVNCTSGHSSCNKVFGVAKKCTSCSGGKDHTLIALYHYQLHWRMMLQTARPSPQHSSGSSQIFAWICRLCAEEHCHSQPVTHSIII